MKIASILLMGLLLSCASKEKLKTRTLGLRLANDGFATVSFNLIELKQGKKTKYVVNAVLDYEAPAPLPIKLDQDKPLVVAVDKEAVTLRPIADKYRYQSKKVSKGERLLHFQSNDYEISQDILDKMTRGRVIVVRVPANPHKNGGFDAVIRKEQRDKIIDFVD